MDYVLTIISILCTLVAIIIGYYQYIKKKIEEQALDAINKAEDTDKIGEEKLKDAVDTIYSLLPSPVKPFINKQLIETIIQKTFDKVEEYAQKQLNKEE